MKKRLFISVVLLASILGALPLYAQESCYAQYLREHNMRVLTAEDADDTYDELKKAVLAWQLYGSEASLPLCPIEEPAAPKLQDTTCVIVHLALVDSTWYMWMSVDPLSDKYPGNTPYLYCNGNPAMLVDPDGRDIYRYDKETGDMKLYQKTDDNFDQIGKFKYNRKTGEYEPRLKKDGSIRTYTDHRGNNDKIVKGILRDGLNIKQQGSTFISDNNGGPTINDYFNFALILDEVAGVEISGFVFNIIGDQTKTVIHISPYKNNSHNESYSYAGKFPETYINIQQFHTHGHAGYSDAIQPSQDLDIPFKNKSTKNNPGKNIIYLILHNYGAPIRY